MPVPFVALWPSAEAPTGALARVFTGQRVDDHEDASVAAEALPPHGGALAGFLPLAARRMLSGRHAREESWLLYIDRDLPDNWHRAPWESYWLEGRSLATTALVARKASAVLSSRSAGTGNRGTAWVDLFPKSDLDFRQPFERHMDAGRLVRKRPAALDEGLDHYDELFILAHGGETGLLDEQGRPFALDGVALPRRVWLLACNVRGAMYRVAEALLERGVETVITSVGDISAPEMGGVVSAWIGRTPGEALESWLLRHRGSRDAEGGARALTVFGQVTIDDSASAEWNHRTWEDLRAGTETRRRLREEDNAQFRAAVHAIESPLLWPETYEWLWPRVLTLAESLDHKVMYRLKNGPPTGTGGPDRLHALARVHYRCGHYDQSAHCIAEGLAWPNLSNDQRADLLADLVLLLIDENLPDHAAIVTEAQQRCRIDLPELRERYEFKRLDWRARIAFKQGRLEEALVLLNNKRGRSNDPTGSRELASLLYMSAWRDRFGAVPSKGTVDWRRVAVQQLSEVPAEEPVLGNYTPAYLLRAIACDAWASHDLESLTALQRWLERARRELSKHDPGPWGFTLAFASLAGIADQKTMDLALWAMEHAGNYYFEAAAFADLAGRHAERDRLFQKHVHQRSNVLAALEPIRDPLGLDFSGISHDPESEKLIPL